MKAFRITLLKYKGWLKAMVAVSVLLGLSAALSAAGNYDDCSPVWFGPGNCGAGGPCNGVANTATEFSASGLSACQYPNNSLPYATGSGSGSAFKVTINSTLNANNTTDTNQLYAAVNGDLFSQNDLCGACALVVNQSGNAYNNMSTTVMITDECPSTGNADCLSGFNHIDLSPLALAAIDGGTAQASTDGVIAIKWQVAPCPVGFFAQSNSTGDITYEFKGGDGTNAYYTPIIIRDTVNPIAGVSYGNSSTGPWTTCTWLGTGSSEAEVASNPSSLNNYNAWAPTGDAAIDPTAAGDFLAGDGQVGAWTVPFWVQVTDTNGKTVVFEATSTSDPGPNSGDPETDWAQTTVQLPSCVVGSPTDTPTQTPTVTPTSSDTPAGPPTPTFTPTPNCPYTLWGASSGTTLSSNGTWSAVTSSDNPIGDFTLSTSTSELTGTAAESLEVAINGADEYMNNFYLAPTQTNWTDINGVNYGTGNGSISFDIYISSASALEGSGDYLWLKIGLNSGQTDPTGGLNYPLSGGNLVTGWNAVTLPLEFPVSGLNYSDITELWIMLNTGTTTATDATVYIANVVLNSGTACASPTISPTGSKTYTSSPTDTPTVGNTSTFTDSPTLTGTRTATGTPSITLTVTSSDTASETATPSSTKTPTATPSVSGTASETATPGSTKTPTATPSVSGTASETATPSSTRTPTDTPTATNTGMASDTATPTRTPTVTFTSSVIPSVSDTPTNVPPNSTPTSTPTISPSFSVSPSVTASATSTLSVTDTATATATDTAIAIDTATDTDTATESDTPLQTPTATATPTATLSFTSVPVGSTATQTSTATASFSATGTDTFTCTVTVTATFTATATPSLTNVPANDTDTVTSTDTVTDTVTNTVTATQSFTSTSTSTPNQTPSVSGLTPGSVAQAGGTSVSVDVTGVDVSPSSPAELLFVEIGGSGESITVTAVVSGAVWTVASPDLSAQPTVTQLDVYVLDPGSNPLYAGVVQVIKGTTATATPSTQGPAQIIATLPVPNPWDPGMGPGSIAIELAGPADDVVLKVYTKALMLVGSYDFGPQLGGWDELKPLPSNLAGVAGGLYYYTVRASRNGASLAPTGGKLYILR